ncbi:hypothetical protein PVAP13_8KG243003 [Panicum virgatum]|uniref:DUF4220 domain-containing protein n=1 Tax=Panicum virgatum TaxID=38727 RepID=A0A8T0PWT8_PANVG|nr:hypothetical protein PVAP13_8KG243003 [Panicum virgatum]
MNLPALLTDLLTKWNQEAYVMPRIELFMVLLTLLYYVMFVLSFGRLRVPQLFNFLDAVCDSILGYAMGVMQAAPFKNQLYPIWGLVLAGRVPFWILWGFLVLKSLNRILSGYLVSKSLWHGQSSKLLQEYMDVFTPDTRCNPETMEGYTYLVYEESKKNIKIRNSSIISSSRSLVTLDKIWECGDPLLRRRINKWGNNAKDMCLAFALFRLLRCRLEGATLHEGAVSTTRKLICSRIPTDTCDEEALVDNAEKAFGVLRMELAFLSAYLHTGFPMVFWKGLLSLAFALLQCVVRLSMVLWLAEDYFIQWFKPKFFFQKPEITITGIAIGVVFALDFAEAMMYIFSRWMMLLCTCKYVNGSKIYRHFIRPLGSVLVLLPMISDIHINQYIFLQSFNYSAWRWKLVHALTMGVVESKSDGTKLSGAIKLPQNVKVKVFEALGRLRSMNLEVHHLPRDFTPLHAAGDSPERYWSACLELPTCSCAILVLHVATSLCQMKLTQDHPMELSKTGCLRSFLAKCRRPSKHYLLDEKSLDGELRTNYEVANSLSRYCAYLLVSRPDLLPDTILVSKVLMEKAVGHARDVLKDCDDSWQSIYSKLMEVPLKEPSVQGSHQRKLSVSMVEEGAKLATKLIDQEKKEHRWEILAKIWVSLLIHIAPSSNAEAHTKDVKTKREFISHIWALFCHCGIEKSELWQECAGSRNDSPGSSQQNNGAAVTGVLQTAASAPPGTPPECQASSVFCDLEGGKDILIIETSPTLQGKS